jgi:hypothetical protein
MSSSQDLNSMTTSSLKTGVEAAFETWFISVRLRRRQCRSMSQPSQQFSYFVITSEGRSIFIHSAPWSIRPSGLAQHRTVESLHARWYPQHVSSNFPLRVHVRFKFHNWLWRELVDVMVPDQTLCWLYIYIYLYIYIENLFVTLIPSNFYLYGSLVWELHDLLTSFLLQESKKTCKQYPVKHRHTTTNRCFIS